MFFDTWLHVVGSCTTFTHVHYEGNRLRSDCGAQNKVVDEICCEYRTRMVETCTFNYLYYFYNHHLFVSTF